MNQLDHWRRVIANWEAAGQPRWTDCREPVWGKANMSAWEKNGHRCPVCARECQRVQDLAYQSNPPPGIARE